MASPPTPTPSFNEWSNEKVLKFIELLAAEPAIWNVECPVEFGMSCFDESMSPTISFDGDGDVVYLLFSFKTLK